ncbi:RING-type domain-containing protein [Pycnococcus provasolii]
MPEAANDDDDNKNNNDDDMPKMWPPVDVDAIERELIVLEAAVRLGAREITRRREESGAQQHPPQPLRGLVQPSVQPSALRSKK